MDDRVWWSNLPVGYYAVDDDYVNDDCTESWPVTITTFRRTTIGFRMGQTYRLPDYERIPAEDRYLHDGLDLAFLRGLADVWVRDADKYRAAYGRFAGKCGCCGRRLTDPESKLRGIGPDCWAGLKAVAP